MKEIEILGGCFDDSFANYIFVELSKCVNSSANNYCCESEENISKWDNVFG